MEDIVPIDKLELGLVDNEMTAYSWQRIIIFKLKKPIKDIIRCLECSILVFSA